MSIFNTVPWKAIASFMPTVMELVRDVKGGDNSITELRLKIERLEQHQKSLTRNLQMLMAGCITALLLSTAALVIGIIYLSRG